MDGLAHGRLREVDGIDRALLYALAAEGAGLEVDGAHDAAVVVVGEDRLLARFGGLDRAHGLTGAAVHAGVGDDVGEAAQGDLEVAGAALDRLDRGAPPDVQVRVVDDLVAVEALAHPGLLVAGRQALAAVVGREDGADARGAAAEEGPPLDELHAVAHLGDLGGGLRAGHAAADDEHLVAAVAVGELVGHGGRVGDGRFDEADRLVGDGVDVVVVHPAAALADVGDLEVQAAGAQLLEAARREVGRAAGEDELAPVAGLHQLEKARLALATAPVTAAQHVGVLARGRLEAVEVDVVHRAGALAEEDERARVGAVGMAVARRGRGRGGGAGRPRPVRPGPVHPRRVRRGPVHPLPVRPGRAHDAVSVLSPGVATATSVSSPSPAGTSGGRASIASTGQLRAQLPQPMQRSSS